MGLFYAIVRTVRFLLQAKIAGAARQRGLTDEFLAAELLPDDARSNLMKIHVFPRGKYLKAAPAFSASDLMEALQSLYEINRCLIPSADDLYVADVGFLFEKLLIQLCGGMRSAAPN
ncbi:MAG: hypothetical protein BWZ10_03349 [candidate division BRC1 bacterium ADurb.BinA364]|nr:MAG: hypothetical protein BWZ10_03349 [candidate division BRC1 bacterium ADurb.BinA364]